MIEILLMDKNEMEPACSTQSDDIGAIDVAQKMLILSDVLGVERPGLCLINADNGNAKSYYPIIKFSFWVRFRLARIIAAL